MVKSRPSVAAEPLPLSAALPWLALALLVFGAALHKVWPFTIDDAFISARYARNLADGYGLVFNPGALPSEGYSNLTLVLLTALGVRLGVEAITAAKLIAAVSGFACLLLATFAGRLLLPRHYPLAVLLAATAFPLILWSSAGLETSLMALLTATWLYLGLLLVLRMEQRTQWPLAAVTVLAALTRPEGLLLLPALALVNCRARRAVRISWWPLAAAVAALALHEVWRVSYFGLWLPLPFYAKVELGSAVAKLSGVYYLHTFLWSFGAGLAGYLALLHAWLRRDAAGVEAGGYVALLALLPFLAFVVLVGADWMPQYRFLVPAIVPLSLLLVGLLLSLRDAWAQTAPRLAATLFACGLAVLFLGNAAAAWRAFATDEWHSTKMERLDVHRGASEALRAQGEWLREHGGSRLTVAALDIGAPAYYSDAHLIDMHGLTNPDLAGKSSEAVADYVLQRHPDFIQVYG
ncbi:MAG: hypothetical protein WCP21_06045, partial [Armatimonadota bacterium]